MNKTRKTHVFVGLFLFIVILGSPTKVEAKGLFSRKDKEKRIDTLYEIAYTYVDRVGVLEKFFEKYDSPLMGEAQNFVEMADEKGLDYRLLPAISCMESTCGRFIIPETYNAWGWGMSESALRNGTYLRFDSWEEAIETVGEGIAKNYANKGLNTPEKMAPVYTPPNYVNWRNGVRFFMNQMDEIALSS